MVIETEYIVSDNGKSPQMRPKDPPGTSVSPDARNLIIPSKCPAYDPAMRSRSRLGSGVDSFGFTVDPADALVAQIQPLKELGSVLPGSYPCHDSPHIVRNSGSGNRLGAVLSALIGSGSGG